MDDTVVSGDVTLSQKTITVATPTPVKIGDSIRLSFVDTSNVQWYLAMDQSYGRWNVTFVRKSDLAANTNTAMANFTVENGGTATLRTGTPLSSKDVFRLRTADSAQQYLKMSTTWTGCDYGGSANTVDGANFSFTNPVIGTSTSTITWGSNSGTNLSCLTSDSSAFGYGLPQVLAIKTTNANATPALAQIKTDDVQVITWTIEQS